MRHLVTRHRRCLSVATLAALLVSRMAAAQAPQDALDPLLPTVPVVPVEAPADSEPVAKPAAPRALEEIVVTAQKTAQSLQDVPVSVSAIDGDSLQQSGRFDAAGLEELVANIEIDLDPQAPVIGIRGFSTETDNVGFEPAVGLVMDDVALGRPEFIPDGMFDIERIEVLRGSQGTLFGKNTIAGVITFASYEPEDFWSGRLLATVGDPRESRAEAGLSIPLSDSFAARVSGVYWDRAGDVDNTRLHRDEGALRQRAGRIKLRVAPAGPWTISLSSQISDTHVDYAPWQLYDADDNALDFARNYDPEVEDDPLDAQASFDRPGYVDRRSDLSRLRADYEAGTLLGLDGVVVTGVVGHAAFDLATLIDIDASPADVIVTDFGVDYAQDSLELRAAAQAGSLFGFGGDVGLVVGVFGLRSDLSSHLDTHAGADLVPFALTPAGLDALGASLPGGIDDLLNLLPPLPGTPIEDALLRGFEQDTESVGLFGQLDWNVFGHWSVIAGLRWGEDRKTARFDVQTTGLGLVGLVVGADTFMAQRERREDDLSPKLGLQYAWTPSINSYVTWTRGYKGGGFNATAETQDNLEFEAERAQSWEAGFKSRLLDGTLMLNLALYRSDIDELQVVDFTGFSFQVRNAAEARLQGAELDLRWLSPWAWLAVDATLALSEAKYLRYTNAPPTEDQQEQDMDVQDLSGRSLANAPEVTASISPLVSLPFPFGRDLGIQIGVDLSYRGDQYSATDLDPRSFQSGYLLLGSRVVLGRNDGTWSLVLAGRNLTDERALDLVMDHSVYSRTYIAQQIPLRSVSLSLQAQWY